MSLNLIKFVKRIPGVLYQKSSNNELQESFAPIYPKQPTRGEFQMKILNSLIEKHENNNSGPEDEILWEEQIKWLYNSYYFPERQINFVNAKIVYKDYKNYIMSVIDSDAAVISTVDKTDIKEINQNNNEQDISGIDVSDVPQNIYNKPIEDMSVDELLEFDRYFDCHENDNGQWMLYMGMCSVGGCYMKGVPYPTQKEGLVNAVKLTQNGERPSSYCCSDCRKMLNDIEEDWEDERENILEERSNLKGTGSVILEVISVECTELRQCYDSTWVITVKTVDDGVQKVHLLYRDVGEESIRGIIKECRTTGDIESYDKKGLIYYD